MKRLLPLLLIPLSLLSFHKRARAQAVCQDITVQLDASGNYVFTTPLTPWTDADVATADGSTTNTVFWQSFTPTVDGILDNITVTFALLYGPNTLVLNIYSGQGTLGTLIHSQSVPTPGIGGAAVQDIAATLDLVGGTEYTFEIIDLTGSFAIQRNGSDPYVGGISSIAATTDLWFSFDLLQRPLIDNGSTSPLGIQSFGLSQTAFGCADLGNVTVQLTSTDKSGTSTTCQSTVTVQDNISPTATCAPAQLSLDASGNAAVDPNIIDDGSSDNCSITLTTDITNFTCADVGVNPITLTATDPAGNSTSCSTQVEVIDDTPPSAICQDVTLQLDGSGAASIVPNDIDNGSSDNCAIASRTVDILDFNCSDLGVNPVVLTVDDVNGNSSTCSATVTIQDVEIPVITCPSDIVLCSTNASGILVNYAAAVGSDNCVFTINQSDGSGLTSGVMFPIGVTLQEWTITDVATNTSSCSFNITVNATPVADYSYTPSCQNEAIFFTDLSTIDLSTSIVSWTWNMGDGSAPIGLVDPIHQYADTGMYVVQLVVESAEGCTDTMEQTLHTTPVPMASFTYVGACEGNQTVFTNTSSIDAGNLNYAWDFGDGSAVDNTESPSHVYALNGTYTVTLTTTSDNGCEDVATASINVNNSPTALFVATTACQGTATVFSNLSTGDGTLTYLWDFGDGNTSTDTSPTYLYAASGSYTATLTATNADLCEDVISISVIVNGLPNVDFTFTDVCEGTQADFVNTSDPGTNEWALGDGSSSTLTDVSHTYALFGTNDVTLTVTSPEFCINSLTQQIEVFDLPDFTLSPTDVSCYGEASGVVEVVAAGNPAPPWSLSLNGGVPQSSTLFFNGLTAGQYEVMVVDSNSCSFSVQTDVNQPSDTMGIVLSTVVDNFCHGDASGTIEVSGSGGTPPYSYQIDGGNTQPNGQFPGLSAGSHDVQIMDAHSCVFDTSIVLSQPDTLVLGLSTETDLLCNGDNSGWLSVSATGGITAYEYNLDGGASDTASTFNGLAAGTYLVQVVDANGCSDTLHVVVAEPGILQLSLIASDSAQCFGEFNGSIQTEAASGTSPYVYSLDGINFQGTGLFQGLAAGAYSVTAMDANGCLDQLTETIFEPSQLIIETNSVPVSCFGDANGEILISAQGGTPSYNYSIDAGLNFFANGGVFNGLSGNSFLAVVQDANGCSSSEGVVISEPSSAFGLDADITDVGCMGDATGQVLLIGTGGTPTYVYSEDGFSFITPNMFSGFAVGSYMLYAQDLNGCLDSVEVQVGEPSSVVAITGNLTSDPACPNEPSGSITVQATGGTPGYTYSSDGGSTYQSSPILSGLGGGNHLVLVSDSNGCLTSDTVALVSPPILSVGIDSLIGVPCENDFSGEIHVTASGGSPSYNYDLNGGNIQSNGDFINLTNGTYQLNIMDVNGCAFSQDITVPAAQMLPLADFSFLIAGESVLFTNESSYGNTYLWDFGDGTTSTEFGPTHVYTELGEFDVTLTVTNECSSSSVIIHVSTINTGIGDDVTMTFALFPNPATNEIFISPDRTIDEKTTIEIMSSTGQLIRMVSFDRLDATSSMHIDLSGLSQGVYFMRIGSVKYRSILRFDIIK